MTRQKTQVTRVSSLPSPQVGGEACFVCIYGPDIGKKWTLRGGTLSIGRGPQNDIVVDLDNVSRRHAEISGESGLPVVRDLGSTNGTFLNDEEVTEQVLANEDHLKIGGAIFKFLAGGNVESLYHEEIYRMTIIDGLTQIHNKRYFLEAIEREMARAARFERPLHLMMIDVDHFKNVNDEFGHIAGDYVLRELAGVIDRQVRKEEVFARYGGEEFALMVPEAAADKVHAYAEKLRAAVEGHPFVFEDRRMPVTISIGVAGLPDEHAEVETFIKLADEKLYAAKRGGRNRVVA